MTTPLSVIQQHHERRLNKHAPKWQKTRHTDTPLPNAPSQKHAALFLGITLARFTFTKGRLPEELDTCRLRSTRSSAGLTSIVLSQEDKPKRYRSAREISHETAILRSSVVHRIIHRDLQLKCFKRCPPVWLLCETNRISHLTRWYADKQPYRLQ